MRKPWLNINTVGSGLLSLAGLAVTLGGWVSPTTAYVILGCGITWFTLACVYWFRSKKKGDFTKETVQSKAAIGGLIGKASGVKIRDCHFRGKIIVSGRPEKAVIGGLIGQSENAEAIDCSADAEIEYEQDDR